MDIYDIEVTTIDGAAKWNFTKFLVGSDGTVLKRYAPTDTPEKIAADLAVMFK